MLEIGPQTYVGDEFYTLSQKYLSDGLFYSEWDPGCSDQINGHAITITKMKILLIVVFYIMRNDTSLTKHLQKQNSLARVEELAGYISLLLGLHVQAKDTWDHDHYEKSVAMHWNAVHKAMVHNATRTLLAASDGPNSKKRSDQEVHVC